MGQTESQKQAYGGRQGKQSRSAPSREREKSRSVVGGEDEDEQRSCVSIPANGVPWNKRSGSARQNGLESFIAMSVSDLSSPSLISNHDLI
jgi:hypothetical protein